MTHQHELEEALPHSAASGCFGSGTIYHYIITVTYLQHSRCVTLQQRGDQHHVPLTHFFLHGLDENVHSNLAFPTNK